MAFKRVLETKKLKKLSSGNAGLKNIQFSHAGTHHFVRSFNVII
jgi:hypothetical protein